MIRALPPPPSAVIYSLNKVIIADDLIGANHPERLKRTYKGHDELRQLENPFGRGTS